MFPGSRPVVPRTTDILARRGPKATLDPAVPYASLYEEEPGPGGDLVPTATIFLTNRECPFRCLMCDLWVHTLDGIVPPGSIPRQIALALDRLPPARHLKLYNAGSFFDPQAIPPDDDDEIAAQVASFERVIVEAHPAFLAGPHGERCVRFNRLLAGGLEVAVGLETSNPDVLARLNKGMTVDAFRRAAAFLAAHAIGLRVFILLNPPYLPGPAGTEWACRSIDEAVSCGAAACAVIPTRGGNGILETLGRDFVPPRLPALESVLEYGLSLNRIRVFADLWDIERFFDCACSPARAERLRTMNREQRAAPRVECTCADQL